MNSSPKPISDIRKEYESDKLDIHDVKEQPIAQFQSWLSRALQAELLEPTAMHLSTVSSQGKPSGRIVLLKSVDYGLVFFTNYNSRKGHEIAEGQFVAATMFWDKLEQQIRVEGTVEKLTDTESDTYFHSRPYKSQLGAFISPQSQVIASRAELEEAWQKAEAEYPEGSIIPRPSNWGGCRIIPSYFEFWQGRRSRLHDRIIYNLQIDNTWKIERLAP